MMPATPAAGRIALAAVLVLVVGCRSERAPAADSPAAGSATTDTTAAAASGRGSAAQLEAHLQATERLSGDRLGAALPAHRQAVANALAEMNREMRSMNMAGDAAWTALVDSLRQDLRTMPDLGAGELSAMMPAHRERAGRLARMHREMMGRMKM